MTALSSTTNECHENSYRFEYKSKPSTTIHKIGRWSIEESFEPFEQKENKSTLSTKRKKQSLFNESNIHQWNVDDVCLFFISVLETTCYSLIIREHLIDGAALLLLEDKHLMKFFQMPLEYRLKLLRKIARIKKEHSFL
ncbi:hypothetical protein I4U23_014429 [Adineta vaga]|nr:hypothetical protein I4U23_014429 [Adineta vaga]